MYQIRVTNKQVCCDGTSNADTDEWLEHPLIYLDMGSEDSITCPYCSKVFIYDCVEQV